MDNRHGEAEGQADRQLQSGCFSQQFEFMSAATELEGGRRFQQEHPPSSGEKTRCCPAGRLAQEHRGSQHRQGNVQVSHFSGRLGLSM